MSPYLKAIYLTASLLAFLLIQPGTSAAQSRQAYLDEQLCNACEQGHLDDAQKLLKLGANVNAHRGNSRTPLWYAVEDDHPEIVGELARHGAKVDALDYYRWTPLLWAIDHEYFDTLGSLLAAGADPNYMHPRYGLSPVFLTKRSFRNYRDDDAQRLDAAEKALAQLLQHGANEALSDAAGLGDLETAAKLIDAGTPVDQRDRACETPLMHACTLEDPAMLNLLLSHGANPNARGRNGKTVLIYTTDYRDFGEFQAPEILIKHGARVDDKDRDGKSALMYSTDTRGNAVTKTLLRYHANTRLRDKNGMTALMHAADWGMHAESAGLETFGRAVPSLLASGAEVNARDRAGRTALLISASRWNADSTVKELLNAGANPNIPDNGGATPLMYALKQEDKEEADLLRKAGARPGLMEYVLMKDTRQALNAIAKGANVNVRGPFGLTPLTEAARQREMTLCRSLLAAGASLEARDIVGNTPLHIAAGADGGGWRMRHSGYNHWQYMSGGPSGYPSTTDAPEVLELLFAAGADIDAKDKQGATPLMWAAVWGFAEDVRVLLAHGANVRGREGSACIEDAIGLHNESILEVLLDYGAEPDAADNRGTPLLMFAMERHYDAIVERLIACGVNVNRRDRDGGTPLMAAAARGETGVVRRLLAAGADPKLRDFDGKSAMDYADSRSPEILQLLTHSP